MRTTGRAVAVVLGAAWVGSLPGCANNYTCVDYQNCTPDGGGSDASADATRSDARSDGAKTDGGTSDGGTSKDGGGGQDGPTTEASTNDGGVDAPPDVFTCSPTKGPSVEPCIISETYGVFVAPASNGGSTSGTGTRTSPYLTITQALGNTQGLGRIFVCNGTYTDQITVTGAVSIYGGLTCGAPDSGVVGTWAYASGTKGVVTASTPAFALRVNAGSNAVDIEDLEFDGIAGTSAVPTSIGALVLSSTSVTLARITLTSGTGLLGAAGETGANYTGVQATAGNSASESTPGPTLMCTCVDSSVTSGGHGGLGDPTSPSAGVSGSPVITGAPATDGTGGTYNTSMFACENGFTGASSPNGAGSAGATSPGALGGSGWTLGAAGTTGTNAGVAQGGGGGSGGIYVGVPSAGGGGGACGGCGGGGGTGGGAGGSSFALVSAASTVTLNACSLTAGSGGAGGQGGTGQAGQAGGEGGLQTSGGCSGGNGGAGGKGGGGGGGAAGDSIAIAYSGMEPTMTNGTMTSFAPAAAAGGGPGATGTGATPATAGRDGLFLPSSSTF